MHTTHTHDQTSTRVEGLEMRKTGPDAWRIVHTNSGLHLPMVTWPTDNLPQRYAEIAMTRLAASDIDWTQTRDQLRSDMRRLAEAARDAGETARRALTGHRAAS